MVSNAECDAVRASRFRAERNRAIALLVAEDDSGCDRIGSINRYLLLLSRRERVPNDVAAALEEHDRNAWEVIR